MGLLTRSRTLAIVGLPRRVGRIGSAERVQVGRTDSAKADFAGDHAGSQTAERDGPAQDTGLVLVAGRPGRDVPSVGDCPSSHHTFAGAAMLPDRRQFGEQFADTVRIADGMPRQCGHGMGDHGNGALQIAARCVRHDVAGDGGELLKPPAVCA